MTSSGIYFQSSDTAPRPQKTLHNCSHARSGANGDVENCWTGPLTHSVFCFVLSFIPGSVSDKKKESLEKKKIKHLQDADASVTTTRDPDSPITTSRGPRRDSKTI